MNKKDQIEKLNRETLLHSRKNFGMLENIQWWVEDIKDGTLIVKVSSSTKGWGEAQSNGRRLPSKEQIAMNIKESIECDLPDMKAQVSWQDWKPEHGHGFIMSMHGKTSDEAAKEIWEKLYGETETTQINKITIPCNQCGQTAAMLELIPKTISEDKRMTLRIKGFIGEITTYSLGSKEFTDQLFDKIQMLAKTNLKELHSLDQDSFGFICRECGVAYCRNCWSNMIERFDEGFFDDIRATCPKGHAQMIQD